MYYSLGVLYGSTVTSNTWRRNILRKVYRPLTEYEAGELEQTTLEGII
jgi:hypothetical protein